MADTDLSALLVITPTGIYRGRVGTGIDLVLGSQVVKKETKIRVIFVAGKEWVQIDQSYKAEFEEQAGYDITCDCMDLPMEDEEHLTGWLLGQLCLFFKTFRGAAEAYVDLTSAPKEWQFASIYALNFFPRVVLYNVKPLHEKKPSLYDDKEKDDPGIPKLEVVRRSVETQPLHQWIQPKNEKGQPNIHYRLFETIFTLARKTALDKGLDSSDQLHRLWIPIQERNGLDAYRKSFRGQFRRLDKKFKKTLDDDAALRKSISKCLTAVEPFDLFIVKSRSVQMTSRTTEFGQALFAPKEKKKKQKKNT